jgi:tetratricopeptide (TPR) repeat protein
MLWPINLTIYHEGERVPSITYFTIISTIATLLIVALVAYLFIKSKQAEWKKHVAGLIVLIYATMLLSFYPLVVVWAMADRYLYIATVFFGIILGILYDRVKNKKLIGYALVILMAFYAVRTVVRTNDWKNSKNLWLATQEVSPYSYRVYNNLGDIYASEGNYKDAIKNFQTSVMLNPKFADAVHNLGFTYYQIGDKDTAKTYLEKSFEMNPMLYQSLHKLGVIAYEQGNIDLAKQYFAKALEVNPNFEVAAQNLRKLNSLPATTAP